MSEFSPSEVEVTKAIITSYDDSKTADITGNFITSFEIDQSMSAVAWTGSMNIADASNILEGFPLRAEEKLELWIKGYDLDTEYKLKCRIHKIGNISPSSNSNMVTYTIHFISETSFNASLKKVLAPYVGPISTLARTIFEDKFAPLGAADFLDAEDRSKTLPLAAERRPLNTNEFERNFIIQPTVGITKVIIPDLSPTETMFFLAARGFNPDSPSQTFRFFETLQNYYFCTDEYFLKGLTDRKVKNLFYAPVADLTPENAQAQIERIESLSIASKGVDTGMDINSGSYRNEVVEIDLLRREFNISQFNFDDAKYIDMNGTTRDITANPHTEQFRKDVFTKENAKRFMLFKTYQNPGDLPSSLHSNKHIPEIVHNRVSYFHHLNNTALIAGMKGRLDLKPGMVVNVDIKNLSQAEQGDAQANVSLGGRYLIQATKHSVEGRTLNTILRLVKFDWSSGTDGREDQPIPEGT